MHLKAGSSDTNESNMFVETTGVLSGQATVQRLKGSTVRIEKKSTRSRQTDGRNDSFES